MFAAVLTLVLAAAPAPPPGDAAPAALLAGASPLASVALPALLLAGLAVSAFMLTRGRSRAARHVEVVETASLGPRRSLVVARMGGELLLIGASEAGIALLSASPAPPAAARAAAPAAPAPGRGFGLLARLRLRPQRAPAPTFDALLTESAEDQELRRK
ncbi:MAG TPA: flagellar biosynthetic protein FliO, partial [Anaeromyxobacteraceae bacterium]